MAVFRVEKNKSYTVMSNHHLRNRTLSLKAKGLLLSQMLSLPEDWDYTLAGLASINKESKDAIRTAVRELEEAGYVCAGRPRTHGVSSASMSTSSTNIPRPMYPKSKYQSQRLKTVRKHRLNHHRCWNIRCRKTRRRENR